MVKKFLKNPLFWIFLLALILRIYKLGEFPVGFHADEARVGWNALSILKTGADDRGNRFALYYNTFGDFRPTGIFYITIPSIAIFGRTEFAVRFPSALIGTLMIFPIYLFVLELTKEKKIGIFASFLLALSPWHIEVSRGTSEVVMSTFFGLFALYFFIRLIRTNEKKFAFFSIASITLSYLFYHAIRFLAPPFYLIILFYYLKEIQWSKTKRVVMGTLAVIFLLSLYFSTTQDARKRFNQVSIFSDIDINYEIDRIRSENPRQTISTIIFDNKEVIFARRFLEEYAYYFGGGFLLSGLARPFRYATNGVGLITYIEFVFLILGLTLIVKGKKSLLPLALLLIAPIPAAITTEDAPNLHRALFMVPFLITIEANGLSYIYFSKKKFFLLSLALLLLNFALFEHMYFVHSYSHKPYIKNLVLDASSYRNIGAKELSFEVERLKNKYDKIIVTNFPDSPYPWYAFFTNKDPLVFNKSVEKSKNGEIDYENIIFSNLKCPSDDSFVDRPNENILVVDSWECAYESKIRDGLPIKVDSKIVRPDGSEVYILLEKTGPIPERFLKK